MDIEQLGYFVFMKEQEEKDQAEQQGNNNYRSSDFNCSGGTDEPHQNGIQVKISCLPETYLPPTGEHQQGLPLPKITC